MISISYVLSFLLSSSVSTRISTGNDGSRPICAQQPKGGGKREPMAMGFINNCVQELEQIFFFRFVCQYINTCSPRLHLFNKKYEQYFEILLQFKMADYILMYFKMQFNPVMANLNF